MVEEVLVFADWTVLPFDLVEHRLRSVEVKHEICNHAGLNESEPAMQLASRPVFCALDDQFAHPPKMIGNKRTRQSETNVLRFVLNDIQAPFRHGADQQICLIHS